MQHQKKLKTRFRKSILRTTRLLFIQLIFLFYVPVNFKADCLRCKNMRSIQLKEQGSTFMNKIAFAALFFIWLSAMASTKSEVETFKYVELNKYYGKWYEVASIPQFFQKQCIGNTIAEYSPGEKDLVVVINSCDTISGKRSVAEGRARVVDKETNSKLEVTFVNFITWIFSFGGSYWILDVDPEYSYALVSDPSRNYAWILSRTPVLSKSLLMNAEKLYRMQGYDTCKILTSIQFGGYSERKPICELVKNP